jgi:uncharacterized protein involved in cysteine biosynthesis
MRISSLSDAALNVLAASWVEASDEISLRMNVMGTLGAALFTLSIKVSAAFLSRPVKNMCAGPFSTRVSMVLEPKPVVPPVIKMTLPLRLQISRSGLKSLRAIAILIMI